MAQLTDKMAVITGAGLGIGRAIALTMARCGANLVVAEMVKERIAPVVAEIEGLGRMALGVQVDVTRDVEVRGMVAKAIVEFGRTDILVNNAGTVSRAWSI